MQFILCLLMNDTGGVTLKGKGRAAALMTDAAVKKHEKKCMGKNTGSFLSDQFFFCMAGISGK